MENYLYFFFEKGLAISLIKITIKEDAKMKTKQDNIRVVLLAIVSLALFLTLFTTASWASSEKISSFGKYYGYSESIYDGFERKCVYVPNRNGLKLAVKYFLLKIEWWSKNAFP
jgi:hypothetical protein